MCTTVTLEDALKAATDTRLFLVGDGAIERGAPLLRAAFPEASVFLVSDANTWQVAGQRSRAALEDAGFPVTGSFVFDGTPTLHARYHYAAALAATFRKAGGASLPALLPVSIGSGTVNDLVKRAAFEVGRPYLSIPTAASVDGYTSYGAALLADGFKKTFECPAPWAVLAESSILACAPAYLTSSGFGDLASKIVAGSDWILAEVAGKAGAQGTERINELAWGMTQTELRERLLRSEGAAHDSGDTHLQQEAVSVLFEALALTGFSMQYLKSSRPVSGCEHLFSHVWEMGDLSMDGRPVTHGHKVAIGTLAATAFTEILFRSPEPPKLPPLRATALPEREKEVRAAFAGMPALESVLATATAKLPNEETLASVREAFLDQWKGIREQVLTQLLPYESLRAQLGRARCPTRPRDIGLSREAVLCTAGKAQMIRNRYTALDLARDLGLFETVLSGIEEDPQYLY